MPLTIIFDRSAFHGNSFDLLVASPLLDKVKSNCLTIHHTPVFVEETLKLYLKDKNHPIAAKQIPYILEICNGHWMEMRDDIWQHELVENRGLKTNPFSSRSDRASIEGQIRTQLLKGDLTPVTLSLNAIEESEIKKRNQHSIYIEVRNELAQKRREQPALKNQKASFPEIVRRLSDHTGRALINALVHARRKDNIWYQWRMNKERYPYFTNYAHGLIYSGYYAMAKPNDAIDRNAQEDLEQLTYLQHADILVSNDRGFQYELFCEFWKPKGKLFFSTEDLVHYLTPGMVRK